jgi:hypothetical protein
VPYCNRSAFEKTSVVLDADYDSRIAGAGIGLGAIKLLEKNPQASRRTFLKVLGIGGVGAALMTLPPTLRAQTRALNRQDLLKRSYNFFKHGVGLIQEVSLSLKDYLFQVFKFHHQIIGRNLRQMDFTSSFLLM